ncbi:MAG: zinc-ribbon and DUF3426 domain-containing protein [Gammaproteobacteria bacterium]|nr:zinc-ribbon and DUF3426 domain-containing protein [Gammaproteobacteria bacterium]
METATHIQTRCPNCQTVFEISDDIVNNDDPRVRCGECYAIFNARENMLVSSLSDDLLLDAEPDDDMLLALDPAVELSLDNDRIFFEPDNEANDSQAFSDSDLFSADAQLPEVDYLEDDGDIPELDFESIDPEDDQFDGTLFDDVSIDEPDETLSEPVTDGALWHDDAETPITPPLGDQPEPAATAVDDFEAPADFLRPANEHGGSRWKTRALMALALIVGLGGLYAYSNRNVPDSSLTRVSDTVCGFINCDDELKASLSDLRVIRRNVYTHPKVDNALVINIVFRNDAEVAQPYPTLGIQMSDVRGKVVAQRDFLPYEYLRAAPGEDLPVIEAAQVVDVSLEVNDPGDDAKSFELEFK